MPRKQGSLWSSRPEDEAMDRVNHSFDNMRLPSGERAYNKVWFRLFHCAFPMSRGHCESPLQRRCYCQRAVLGTSLMKFLVLYMIRYSKKKKVWIFAVSLAGRKRKIPLIRFAFKDISKLSPIKDLPHPPALCKANREETVTFLTCVTLQYKGLWNWTSLGWDSVHMISFHFSQVERGWEDWLEENDWGGEWPFFEERGLV